MARPQFFGLSTLALAENLPGLDLLDRSFRQTSLWPASSMLLSMSYLIVIVPFMSEVVLSDLKVLKNTDISLIRTFYRFTPEAFSEVVVFI
jgi:hypothetical protein